MELTRVQRSALRYGHEDDQPGSPETLWSAMDDGATSSWQLPWWPAGPVLP